MKATLNIFSEYKPLTRGMAKQTSLLKRKKFLSKCLQMQLFKSYFVNWQLSIYECDNSQQTSLADTKMLTLPRACDSSLEEFVNFKSNYICVN